MSESGAACAVWTDEQRGRARLAERQAALVRALLAGGPVPAGFDAERVRIEARALHAKRRDVAQRLRPDLAEALGDRFGALFDEWAVGRPRRSGVSLHAALEDFARWLAEAGHVRRSGRRFSFGGGLFARRR